MADPKLETYDCKSWMHGLCWNKQAAITACATKIGAAVYDKKACNDQGRHRTDARGIGNVWIGSSWGT